MPNITRTRVALLSTASLLIGAFALLATLIPSTEPAAANPLNNFAMIDAGGNHTCGVTDTGAALCWGNNHYGQLGDGTTTDRGYPTGVSGLDSGVLDIASGDNHTCAVLQTGAVKCWGYNRYGQLGNPQNFRSVFDPNPTPLDVIDMQSGGQAVTAGAAHTCLLTEQGGVKCWGWDRRGQLGDGAGCPSFTCTVPRDASGLTAGVSGVDAGAYHNCAALVAGTVRCWGQNDFGQLGVSTGSPCVEETLEPIACSESPLEIPGLSQIVAVAGGGIDTPPLEAGHTCALTSSGTPTCWGANESGQLGDGQACGMVCQTPVEATGSAGDPLTGMSAIAAGGQHTCAARAADGALLCWGDNSLGQLGNGDAPTDRLRAAEVCADADCGAVVCIPEVQCGVLTGVTAVSLGLNHSCALLGGAARCWASNSHGQLGDAGVCGETCDTPTDVTLPKGALPDLTIDQLRVELETGGSCAFTSTALGVRVQFRNAGAGDAGPFAVEVDGVQQVQTGGLPGGSSASLWFEGYQAGAEAEAVVDATSLITESNEANNSHSKILPIPTLPAPCTPTPPSTPVPPTLTPTATQPAATQTPAAAEGDANCDGTVNSIDAALVLQHAAALLPGLPCAGAADVNDDSDIDAIDAALILQHVAGLLSAL